MQRCSSEAGVRDCPPHRPEEQWLCCFARLQRETPKQKYRRSIERKSNQLYATLMPQESLDTGGTSESFTRGKAGEKHRACGLSSRPPPTREAEAGEKAKLPGVIGYFFSPRDAPKPIAIVFLLSCCLELL